MENHLIITLPKQFYNTYNNVNYPELLDDENRPFYCIEIQTEHYDIYLPFRSNMKHKNGYRFRHSYRSTQTSSGLDYSKVIVLSKQERKLCSVTVVDQDEYNEFCNKYYFITEQCKQYVENYVKHCLGVRVLKDATFERKYGKSTLPYFHTTLGIKNVSVTDTKQIALQL